MFVVIKCHYCLLVYPLFWVLVGWSESNSDDFVSWWFRQWRMWMQSLDLLWLARYDKYYVLWSFVSIYLEIMKSECLFIDAPHLLFCFIDSQDPTEQTKLDTFMVHELDGTTNEWGWCKQKVWSWLLFTVPFAAYCVNLLSLYEFHANWCFFLFNFPAWSKCYIGSIPCCLQGWCFGEEDPPLPGIGGFEASCYCPC